MSDHGKYYGVRNGRMPGVYHNYKDVKTQISGFAYPIVKTFDNYADAYKFVHQDDTMSEPLLPRGGYAIFIDARCYLQDSGIGMLVIGPNGETIKFHEHLESTDQIKNHLYALYRALELVESNVRKGIIQPRTPILVYSNCSFLVENINVHSQYWNESNKHHYSYSDDILRYKARLYNNNCHIYYRDYHSCRCMSEASKLAEIGITTPEHKYSFQ